MKKLLCSLLVPSAALACPAAAAPRFVPRVVDVWPDGRMPGHGANEAETERPSQGDHVLRLINVSRPTLEIFPAPRDGGVAPALIVCPGGGYEVLAYNKEGTEIAAWLNGAGITALVLKYRIPDNREGALQDVQRSLRLARAHAAEWNIDPSRLGVLGFSAGAHLAARVSTGFAHPAYAALDAVDDISCRPDFEVLVYPAYLNAGNRPAPELDLSGDVPPTLLIHSEDDGNHVAASRVFNAALDATKIPHDYKLYATGGHGYGLRCTMEARAWPHYALDWLRKRGVLARQKEKAYNPPPTSSDVPYGANPRQVLDFWKASSKRPAPVIFYIHGGGWVRGDKSEVPNVQTYLDAGISVVSINYRFTWQAQRAGVQPPVEWPVHDAARALQFVRSKAGEWNIDKTRIAVSGRSAGGCTSLWLAFHEDLADPGSNDPVSRESTRPFTAAAYIAQTSLDPKLLLEWTPNSRYGGSAFGLMDPEDLQTRDTHFAEFLESRSALLPWIEEYSPMQHASAGDPDVCLFYDSAPGLGQPQKDPTHTANFGVKLLEKLRSLGVGCELAHPGAPDIKHADIAGFLLDKLKADETGIVPQ